MRWISRIAVAVGLVTLASQAGAATVCNGFAELCDRPYDEVTYPATHNSFASLEDGYVTFNGNQSFGVARQLADGIRAVNFDTYLYNGVVTLCHGGVDLCPLASKPLAEELATVKAFLDANPQEVVTIAFQDGVSASDTAAVFEQVGLYDSSAPSSDYLYAHGGGAWPTLGELIDSGERMVVFTGKVTSFPWFHHVWTWTFRSDYRAASVDDFTCDLLSGNASNDLFMLPHFITGPVGSTQALSAEANANPFFADRVQECSTVYSRVPNFVRVDYYDIGELFTVVEDLNGTQSLCFDLDGDGYGSPPSPQCSFAQPDCDDSDGDVHPGASEISGNGIDDDCNPRTSGGCGGTIASSQGAGADHSPLAALLLMFVMARRRRQS